MGLSSSVEISVVLGKTWLRMSFNRRTGNECMGDDTRCRGGAGLTAANFREERGPPARVSAMRVKYLEAYVGDKTSAETAVPIARGCEANVMGPGA